MSSPAPNTPRIPLSPEGYKTFLVHAAKRRRWAEEHLTNVLATGLLIENPNLVDRTALARAAEHALIALEHNGWELMFDADGQFATVVT